MIIEDNPTLIPALLAPVERTPYAPRTRGRAIEGTTSTARWTRSITGGPPVIEVLPPGADEGTRYEIADLEDRSAAGDEWAEAVLEAVMPGRRECLRRGRETARALVARGGVRW